MAYFYARKTGRVEIREAYSTPRGPRSRTLASFRGALDDTATTEQLEHVATLIPDEWLEPMATGSPAQCAEAVKGQLAMGCDGVIMHGVNPGQLRSVIEAY